MRSSRGRRRGASRAGTSSHRGGGAPAPGRRWPTNFRSGPEPAPHRRRRRRRLLTRAPWRRGSARRRDRRRRGPRPDVPPCGAPPRRRPCPGRPTGCAPRMRRPRSHPWPGRASGRRPAPEERRGCSRPRRSRRRGARRSRRRRSPWTRSPRPPSGPARGAWRAHTRGARPSPAQAPGFARLGASFSYAAGNAERGPRIPKAQGPAQLRRPPPTANPAPRPCGRGRVWRRPSRGRRGRPWRGLRRRARGGP